MSRAPLGVLEEPVRELVREEIAAMRAGAGWEWIPWKAWARSSRAARELAREHRIRLCRIGKSLYGHRDDLAALAARSRVDVEQPSRAPSPANDARPPKVSPRVARWFGTERAG